MLTRLEDHINRYNLIDILIFLGLIGSINVKYVSMTVLAFLSILGLFITLIDKSNIKISYQDKIFILLLVILPISYFLNMVFLGFDGHYLDRPSRLFLGVFSFLLIKNYGIRLKTVFYGILFCLTYASFLSYYELVILHEERAHGYMAAIPFGNFALLFGLIGSSYIFLVDNLKVRKNTFLFLSLLILSLWVSLASGTRGGWIVYPFLIFIFSFNFKFIKNLYRVLMICLVFMMILIAYFTSSYVKSKIDIAYEEINLFIKNQNNTEVFLGSFGTRMEMWRYGLKSFSENPIFGKGFVRFDRELSNDVANKKVNSELLHHGHLHNDIINTMAKQGAVGLIIYVIFFIGLFKYFFRRMKDYDLPKEVRFFASMGSLTVGGMFLFSLSDSMFGTAAGITVYVFLIAISAGGMRYYQEKYEREKVNG
jgi:O-antigen ligase